MTAECRMLHGFQKWIMSTLDYFAAHWQHCTYAKCIALAYIDADRNCAVAAMQLSCDNSNEQSYIQNKVRICASCDVVVLLLAFCQRTHLNRKWPTRNRNESSDAHLASTKYSTDWEIDTRKKNAPAASCNESISISMCAISYSASRCTQYKQMSTCTPRVHTHSTERIRLSLTSPKAVYEFIFCFFRTWM